MSDANESVTPSSFLTETLEEARARFAAEADAAAEQYGVFAGVDEDEIGSALEEGVMHATAETPAPREPAPVVDVVAEEPWYLGVNEAQVGPLTAEKVLALWDAGEVANDTLCWREGFSDWRPLWRVAELAALRVPRASVTSAVISDAPRATASRAHPLTLSLLARDEMAILGRPVEETTASVPELSAEPQTHELPVLLPFGLRAPQPAASSRESRVLWALFALIVAVVLAFAVALGVVIRRSHALRPVAVRAPVLAAPEAQPVPPPPSQGLLAPAVIFPVVSAPEPAALEQLARAPLAAHPVKKLATAEVPKAEVPAPAAVVAEDPGDDFDSVFGVKPAAPATPKAAPPSTYVPPPPGGATVPESLSAADIQAFVGEHRPQIAACAQAQKAAQPGVTGSLVMLFSISANGKTSDIGSPTEAFAQAPLASCLTREIASWVFPKHQTVGPPISFPFKF